MATRSLNKVILIGNLTRDPELRYTPQGSAVATFGLATNRSWTTDTGEKKDEAEFHNIVVWNKLAEICSQYLTKGKQAYIEGRLATREWEGQDGQKRRSTEVIASEVIFLGSAGGGSGRSDLDIPADFGLGADSLPTDDVNQETPEQKAETTSKPKKSALKPEASDDDDIPF